MLHDATHESGQKLIFAACRVTPLTSHRVRAKAKETKVRDANWYNANLNSSRRDDVGAIGLVSQLFVEAEMLVFAPFCEADPTGSPFSLLNFI